ncbi:hypothetical protein STEG23_034475, partial [Scotinomys teguina]
LQKFEHHDDMNMFKLFNFPGYPDKMLTDGKFVYMVYYIDRLSYVEPSLHLLDEAHLVIVDNVFDVFLESICQDFIECFCTNVHKGNSDRGDWDQMEDKADYRHNGKDSTVTLNLIFYVYGYSVLVITTTTIKRVIKHSEYALFESLLSSGGYQMEIVWLERTRNHMNVMKYRDIIAVNGLLDMVVMLPEAGQQPYLPLNQMKGRLVNRIQNHLVNPLSMSVRDFWIILIEMFADSGELLEPLWGTLELYSPYASGELFFPVSQTCPMIPSAVQL